MPNRRGSMSVSTGRRPSRPSAHGVLLVELLIGISIGLLIAAAAVTLFAGHLRDNRRLLLESRLMQDLRTAADLVARDLRRAGYWASAFDGVGLAGAAPVASNPYVALAPSAAASDAVSFGYSRDATENGLVDSNEQFGFRLRNAALEIQLGAGQLAGTDRHRHAAGHRLQCDADGPAGRPRRCLRCSPARSAARRARRA